MANKSKPRKSILVRLLVIGVAVYMITSLKSTYDELQKRERELVEVQRQTAVVKLENKEYEELLKDDAKLVENAARERLGYGYPYETYYTTR